MTCDSLCIAWGSGEVGVDDRDVALVVMEFVVDDPEEDRYLGDIKMSKDVVSR